MPNLAATIWSDLTITIAIAVANGNPPTDDEWDAYLQLVDKGVHLPNSHGLAVTDGGGPNAAQRARINKVLAKVRGRKAFSAVVSGSLVIRGLVGALRLFHRETEAFSPVQIRDALRFIGVTESQWGSILDGRQGREHQDHSESDRRRERRGILVRSLEARAMALVGLMTRTRERQHPGAPARMRRLRIAPCYAAAIDGLAENGLPWRCNRCGRRVR